MTVEDEIPQPKGQPQYGTLAKQNYENKKETSPIRSRQSP